MGLDFYYSGSYEVYARINGTDAPVFPLEIEVYSTIASADDSYTQNMDDYQICSEIMVFDVMLLDTSGVPLTSSNVDFVVQLVNDDDSSIVYEAGQITKLAQANYRIEITALIRGDY